MFRRDTQKRDNKLIPVHNDTLFLTGAAFARRSSSQEADDGAKQVVQLQPKQHRYDVAQFTFGSSSTATAGLPTHAMFHACCYLRPCDLAAFSLLDASYV